MKRSITAKKRIRLIEVRMFQKVNIFKASNCLLLLISAPFKKAVLNVATTTITGRFHPRFAEILIMIRKRTRCSDSSKITTENVTRNTFDFDTFTSSPKSHLDTSNIHLQSQITSFFIVTEKIFYNT